MYMIEITEDKMEKLSDHIEQSLKHMGKAMQCVEEWVEEGEMGHRGGYDMRGSQGGRYSGGYGSRYPMHYDGYGMKDQDEWDDMDDMMGERRRRSRRTGRYM